MMEKTLIVFSTKTGINAMVADSIFDVLKASYNMDVTIHDLQNGSPDIAPFQNIIVGGGVKGTNVYDEAVDFLGKDFEGKSVALYFCCEDYENPKMQSTEENTKKALAKNMSLKPIDVVAFGGCMLEHGKPVMDALNMNRVTDWAMEMGKKFNDAQLTMKKQKNLNLLNPVPLGYEFRFFTELGKNTGITASSTVEFSEKLQTIPIKSITFHFQRQDFQKWFKNTVGDVELAKRVDQINIWVQNDENLRKMLSKTVQNRIIELTIS